MQTIAEVLMDILKVLLDIRTHLYGGKQWSKDYFRSTVGQDYARAREREASRQ